MNLNLRIRTELRARLLCDPCTSSRTHRLVLVPERLGPLFAEVERRGGIVSKVPRLEGLVVNAAAQQMRVKYDRRALLKDAPHRFSCSSLTRFAFAHIGLWLPRYAIEQSYCGISIRPEEAQTGDLVFWPNRWPVADEDREVGHVGIVTGKNTMIDGSDERGSVDIRAFIPGDVVCAVRVLPEEPHVIVAVPAHLPELHTAETVATWLQRPC